MIKAKIYQLYEVNVSSYMVGKHVRPFTFLQISAFLDMSLIVRKPVFGVSDQVPHKPGCAITEYSYGLEILDLESRGIVLSM